MFLFLLLQVFVAAIVVLVSIAALSFISKDKSSTLKSCLMVFWGFIFFILALSLIVRPFVTKKELSKSDFYGKYVIDTTYFNPVQAKWQYNHFRFEIKKNDSVYFHLTEGERVIKTYKGKIKTTEHASARLKFKMESPSHHILETPPTIYRDIWNFTLVFNSRKYSNMYFIKE